MAKRPRSFDQWREQLKALVAAAKQNDHDAVLQRGQAVIAMYPEYVGDASPYELIADAAKAKGDAKTEAATLTAYVHEGGQMPALLKRLASLQESAGQRAESAATLERLNYIYPVKDEELHRKLGDLLYAQKQYDGAIREYNAVVAFKPGRQGRRRIQSRAGLSWRGQKRQGSGKRAGCARNCTRVSPGTKAVARTTRIITKTN